MTRINIYQTEQETGERWLDGWFDTDSATRFGEDTDWDGSNHISVNTGSQFDHEELYRTKGGRWVLGHYSNWQGRLPHFEFVDDTAARDWLIKNGEDEAVREHFGEIEEERGPGRPEIGPAVNIRFPDDLLAQVDARATADGISRAEMVRRLVGAALA